MILRKKQDVYLFYRFNEKLHKVMFNLKKKHKPLKAVFAPWQDLTDCH